MIDFALLIAADTGQTRASVRAVVKACVVWIARAGGNAQSMFKTFARFDYSPGLASLDHPLSSPAAERGD